MASMMLWQWTASSSVLTVIPEIDLVTE